MVLINEGNDMEEQLKVENKFCEALVKLCNEYSDRLTTAEEVGCFEGVKNLIFSHNREGKQL